MPEIKLPENLRPFNFHGVQLDYQEGTTETVADCPFCDTDLKFSVNNETGLWKCWVCGASGNPLQFIRKLAEQVVIPRKHGYSKLREERGLLTEIALADWRVFRSTINDYWCVPGYDAKGVVTQLYQYRNTKKGKKFLPTPTLGQSLLGVNLFDKQKDTIYLCEGFWDAVAVYEILKGSDTPANVLATPGCNVFQSAWLPLFAGKKVTIMFDNDHPKKNLKTKKEIDPVGYTSACKIGDLLWGSPTPPFSVKILTWGDSGYSLDYKNGYDLRDALQTYKG
jgi:hypothetical protein